MTSRPLDFHPLARNEASEALMWYRSTDIKVAERFDGTLNRYVEKIEQNPFAFQIHILGTRRCVMRDFPYQIIFKQVGSMWVVIAVAHEKRKPGYWRQRLQK